MTYGMKSFFSTLLVLGVFSLGGCADATSTSEKSSFPNGGKGDRMTDDVCKKQNLYNDGTCHTKCAQKDPDCFDPLKSAKYECQSWSMHPYEEFNIRDTGEDAGVSVRKDPVKDVRVEITRNVLSGFIHDLIGAGKIEPKVYEDACKLSDDKTKMECDLGFAGHATVPLEPEADKTWCDHTGEMVNRDHLMMKGTVDAGFFRTDSEVNCKLHPRERESLLNKCQLATHSKSISLNEWLRKIAKLGNDRSHYKMDQLGASARRVSEFDLPQNLQEEINTFTKYLNEHVEPKGKGRLSSIEKLTHETGKYAAYEISLDYESSHAKGVNRFYTLDGEPLFGTRWYHTDKRGEFFPIQEAKDRKRRE